jgi:nucleotidyltransferase substrate binding protein (TIGR01987 family)
MNLDLSSLEKALTSLRDSVDEVAGVLTEMSPILRDTLRAGVIQHFEVAYELSWKMIKRWLEFNVNPESVDGVSRRELFRLAAENQLIDDVDEWMGFHRSRNETSHTYDVTTACEVYDSALDFVNSATLLLARLKQRND